MVEKTIKRQFNIPEYCVDAGENKTSCLVPERWIHSLQHNKYMRIQSSWYDQFADTGQLLLSPSNVKIPKPWMRVCIQVLEKDENLVQSLVEEVLCYGEGRRTYGEDSLDANQDYWHKLEYEALKKYKDAFILPQEPYQSTVKVRSELMRMVLCKLFKCVILDLEKEQLNWKYYNEGHPSHPNILQAYGIFESKDAFFVVHPYVAHTIQSLVSFSPAVVSKSHAKPLFIVYQLLQSMKYCHNLGIAVGDISLHTLNVDDKLWVQLLQPKINKIYKSNREKSDSSHTSPLSPVRGSVLCYNRAECYDTNLSRVWNNVIEKHASLDLPDVTMKWMLGTISNFEYLLLLNYLAGRRIGDPNHHPVIPWVMDFTNPGSNYRDFTKSKYRLNKGDAQLDQTYSVTPTSLPVLMKDMEALHIPHHISDVLSDITYYVYKARQTPRSVLCDHVRSNWVPHEYPASMERLFAWTPDECIPEFFIDPSIFQSVHDDLNDLAIPCWAANDEEFIELHMAVLEGDHVSKNLHQWIDLTFGYKLSGQAAVSSKNVCLQMVDNHTKLVNHGAVQLFTSPHPQKLVASDGWLASQLQLQANTNGETESSQAEKDKRTKGNKPADIGSENTIQLPEKFNPLLLLDKIESLLSFSLNSSKTLPHYDADKNTEDTSSDPKASLISGDMQALACCIVELLVSSKTRSLGANSSIERRFKLCRKICKENWRDISRPFHQVLSWLFQLDMNEITLEKDQYGALFCYSCHTKKKLPPPNVDVLLQSNFNIINFPSYFPSLYETLYNYHRLDIEINKLQSVSQVSGEDVSSRVSELSREKVSVFSKSLSRLSNHMGQEGIELVVPYVKELFSNPLCSVHAVWSLFSPIAVTLGPKKTCEKLLPHIVSVFDAEVTSPKHIKLYHRSFIVQLKVRLTLETFLNTFSTLLVEASAGYKDFASDDFEDKLPTDDHAMPVNVHDGFEVPSDGVVFTLGQDYSDTHENSSLVSSKHEAGVDDHRDEEIDGDILLEGHDDEHKPVAEAEEDTESVASVTTEDQSGGSNDQSSQDLMGRSLGRVSVHSVSRLMDIEGSTPSESGDSDVTDNKDMTNGDLNPGRKSFTSSSGSVHEAVEATDDSVLHSITTIEQKATNDSPKQPEYNLRDVASETIKWLSHLLGPVLTAKYFSRNLLRMLALCYTGEEQLQEVQDADESLSSCKKTLVGDIHASQVLGCLSCIAIIYGEHIILIQYFMHVKQLIHEALQKLSARTEAGLVSCLSLVFHIIPYISDKTLLDVVDETIFGDILVPVLGMVASINLCFPSGSQARRVLSYKAIDILYVISRRIGFEMTREHMTDVLQKFFSSFDTVFDRLKLDNDTRQQAESQDEGKEEAKESSEESLYYMVFTKPNEFKIGDTCDTKWTPQHRRQGSAGSKRSLSPGFKRYSPDDSPDAGAQSTAEIQQQLKETFTPEMAHLAYIPFCRLAGSIYMEQKLLNDDLIRHLCALHDQTLIQQQQQLPSATSTQHAELVREDSTDSSSGFGNNVSMVGNRLTLQSTWGSGGGEVRKKSEDDTVDFNALKSPDMELHQQRHLRENWLAYWEHEVGLSDIEDQFSFKQIRLMTFGGAGRAGHNSSVRSIYVLDNENSFLSASKDKTVKLWSLRSFGDGTGRTGCQWTYTSHKKSVFAVTMLDSLRYAASCDGSVHVWDPFMGACIRTYESAKSSPICVLNSMPAPSTSLLTTTAESVVRLLDVRNATHVYDFKCTTTPIGTIRCASVSGDGHYIAVGYSSGVISVLDVRTGLLLSSWKAHEGEILQMKAFNNHSFVTSSFDQSISLWTFEDPKLSATIKGITEPVHCFDFYKQSLVSATTANRIGVHASLHTKSMFTSIKLKPDVFRGVLTTMAVLPLNKLLLLGSDNGQIRLLA